jgi:RNA polymerase sigma-70 factor (ECF subfamily)
LKNSKLNITNNYIASFCNGDNKAIAVQYKLWLPQLYLIAFRYVKNHEIAEDVVSDCFEKLLIMPPEKRREKFIDEQINLKALLIVMVKNKSLDYIKVTDNRNRIKDGLQWFLNKTTQNKIHEKFSEENFKRLVNCLPNKEQIILKMNLEGYKNEEISKKLQLSEKSISNSLSLSRTKIKNLWHIFME